MREKEISSDGLKFEDLRKRYGTGRSYTISGSGKNRVTGYRTGVMTNIGDIEVSQWERLVHELISRNQEEESIFIGIGIRTIRKKKYVLQNLILSETLNTGFA